MTANDEGPIEVVEVETAFVRPAPDHGVEIWIKVPSGLTLGLRFSPETLLDLEAKLAAARDHQAKTEGRH